MYVLFYVYVGIGFVDWYERFLCVCLLINSCNDFDCPEVTLCDWQDIIIQLPNN